MFYESSWDAIASAMNSRHVRGISEFLMQEFMIEMDSLGVSDRLHLDVSKVVVATIDSQVNRLVIGSLIDTAMSYIAVYDCMSPEAWEVLQINTLFAYGVLVTAMSGLSGTESRSTINEYIGMQKALQEIVSFGHNVTSNTVNDFVYRVAKLSATIAAAA